MPGLFFCPKVRKHGVFHVTPAGNAALCTAQLKACPYSAYNHYESEEEAREAYELENAGATLPVVRTRKKLTRSEAIELDQFFTREELALESLSTLKEKLAMLHYDSEKISFIEPSAGGQAFVKAARQLFPKAVVKQGDICPQQEEIARIDFLNDDITPLLQEPRENRVVIGNPPFGYRGALASAFVNKSLQVSDTVAMVLPAQFAKYATQSTLDSGARLVHSEMLPYDAFTVNGAKYGVQCVFQIWTKREGGEDLRQRVKPAQTHEDFSLWLVGSRPVTKRHLTEADWTHAVTAQGFKGQFEIIERKDAERLQSNRHYMLWKANSEEAAQRLTSIDFEQLASRNTTRIKGFGKADLVEAYSELR